MESTPSHIEQLVGQFDAMVEAVKRDRLDAEAEDARVADVLRDVSAVIRSEIGALRVALTGDVARWQSEYGLATREPSLLRWDPFLALGVERDETRWTMWIAALLRREHGEFAARTTWRAFCRAAAEAAPGAEQRAGTANSQAWLAAADELPLVTHEESFELGRFDIVTRSASFVAVIENKIDAEWHDGAQAQDEKYAAHGFTLRKVHAASHLGLALLTARPQMDARGWIPVSYGRFARHLRRTLRGAMEAHEAPTDTLTLVPLLLTVGAIERHLLAARAPDVPGERASLRELQQTQDLLSKLLEAPR